MITSTTTVCEGCGELFEPTDNRQKYCDAACRTRASSRRWRKEHPGYHHRYREGRLSIRRKGNLKTKYGISMNDYDELLRAQDFKCAICEETPIRRSLCVDHDHDTGAIRGLLCDSCNTGLGRFKDSPEALRKAADYLERSA